MDNELNKFEEQLLQMDEKLERARKARDDYIVMLSKKYPRWNPPFSAQKLQVLPDTYDHFAPVMDRMASGKYYWDIDKTSQTNPHASFEDHAPTDPIPSSGPALDTDLARIKKRLEEISDDLHQLRSHRIYLSSVDFFKTLDPAIWGSSDQKCYLERSSQDDYVKKVYDLRRRIENIDVSSMPGISSPMGASEAALREEYLVQKYGGLNSRMSFSKEAVGSIKHLQEAEARLPDAVAVPLEENMIAERIVNEKVPPKGTDLSRILSVVQDSSDDNEALKGAGEKKIYTRSSELDAAISATESKAGRSGKNFLSKVFGSGAPGSTDSSEDAIRLHDINENDSDSDFFS